MDISLNEAPPLFEGIIDNINPLDPTVSPEPMKQKPKKKSYAKKIYNDPEPEREVLIYDSQGTPVNLDFRNDAPKKSNAYQTIRHKRQDSRLDFKNGIIRQIYKIKLVTNDDALVVVLRSKEKSYQYYWTTAMDLLFENNAFADTSNTSSNNISIAEEEERPNPLPPAISLLQLLRYSPSKTRMSLGKPTAGSMAKKKVSDRLCRKCTFVYGSAEDQELRSLWLGCDGMDQYNECTYWIHACCIGFTDSRSEDFEDRVYYCDKHNPTKTIVQRLKEKKELRQKKRQKR